MALPQYTDEEVKYFHPVVEDALNLAITTLGLEDDYKVLHHPTIRTSIPDFGVVSKHNNKYHLIVEVKRRPNDVVSTRYRHQAKSYVEEAGVLAEKKYYAVTNLEYTDLFLHSNEEARSSVLLQLLNGSPYISGSLVEANQTTEQETIFRAKLTENFIEILQLVLGNTNEYTSMSSKLFDLLSASHSDPEQWHKALMLCGYEWMRGVISSTHGTLPAKIKAAISYKRNPERMARIGRTIDFDTLFSPPYPESHLTTMWDPKLLQEMYSNGKKRISGDELAIFAHEIVYGNRHREGIVMTDPELSSLLAAIAKRIHGENLGMHEIVCDPAAGAGTLLSNIQQYFNDIQPRQIWANEKEVHLQDPLSIRVGLAYASRISTENAPLITLNDVLNLDTNDFENVKVIVMNPPYIRRLDSKKICMAFSERIKEITGTASITNVGHSGLETLFTELIYTLAQPGTTICCILPQEYLQLRGAGAKAFRNFLINKFNIKLIASYPTEGLFKTVTKATSIYATKKDEENENVELLELSYPLADLNVNQTIANGDNEADGIQLSMIPKVAMQALVNHGWTTFMGSGEISSLFLKEYINQASTSFIELKNFESLKLRRGRTSNNGADSLIFPTLNASMWNILEPLIPADWLSSGIRNTDIADKPKLLIENFTDYVLTPPDDAFEKDTENNAKLCAIVTKYISTVNEIVNTGQRKEKKSLEVLIPLLMKEKRNLSNSPALIPRAIRRIARAFYTSGNIYVSTNAFEANGSEENKKLLISWLLTSFAQLNFELLQANLKGMRKLEGHSIKEVMIPDFNMMTHESKNLIIDVFDNLDGEKQFIDLYCPHIQGSPMDEIWYEVLWGNQSNVVKEEVIDYLSDITYERDPQGNCD